MNETNSEELEVVENPILRIVIFLVVVLDLIIFFRIPFVGEPGIKWLGLTISRKVNDQIFYASTLGFLVIYGLIKDKKKKQSTS